MSYCRTFPLMLVLLTLAAVPTGGHAADAAPAAADAEAAQGPAPELMRKWARSCALCHLDGNARAPRAGFEDEWRPRVAQGMDVLLDHTINGLGKMPPLGYCMACDEADFRAMIEFMAGDVE